MKEKVKLEAEVLPETVEALQNMAKFHGIALGEAIDCLANFIPESYKTEEGMRREGILIELSSVLPSSAYQLKTDEGESDSKGLSE